MMSMSVTGARSSGTRSTRCETRTKPCTVAIIGAERARSHLQSGNLSEHEPQRTGAVPIQRMIVKQNADSLCGFRRHRLRIRRSTG